MPTISLVLVQRTHFQFERNSFRESSASLARYAISIVGMAGSFPKYCTLRLRQGESDALKSRPIHVKYRAVRCEDRDAHRDRVGDREKVLLLSAGLLLGT